MNTLNLLDLLDKRYLNQTNRQAQPTQSLNAIPSFDIMSQINPIYTQQKQQDSLAQLDMYRAYINGENVGNINYFTPYDAPKMDGFAVSQSQQTPAANTSLPRVSIKTNQGGK